MDNLGGWPVVSGEGWRPKLSTEKLIGKIRSLNMGTLIELWIGPDDKNSSVNIIQVLLFSVFQPSTHNSLSMLKHISFLRELFTSHE